MEPNRVIKPYMIKPVVHHNLYGPNSNGSSFDSSQDEDDFDTDRDWDVDLLVYF